MKEPIELKIIVTRVLIFSILVSLFVAGALWHLTTAEQVRMPRVQPYDLPVANPVVKINTAAALEFPLFWASRRPVAEIEKLKDEPVQTKAGSIEGVTLLGIIIRNSVRTALLGIDKQIKKVTSGDEINGWIVEGVFAEKIVLTADGQKAELSILRERPDSIKLEPATQ